MLRAKNTNIIAVVGLAFSGKSEATKFFIEKGYKRAYFAQPIFDELEKRGLEINEKNERAVREDLRKEFGMGVAAIRMLPKIRELTGNIVIESMYSWDEYKIVKEEFPELKVIAIVASPKIRYERTKHRKERPYTLEEIKSRDYSQIEKLDQAGPISMADFTIINEGTKEELIKELERVISYLESL